MKAKENILTLEEIRKFVKPVDPKSHKGTFGHALIIGGSHGKIGAACLAAKAALRAGSGLVTAFIPECGYDIIQTAIPEVMAMTDLSKNYISQIKFAFDPNAIGIGPGMGQEQATQLALYEFLQSNKIPLVVDADALNILSKNKSWLKLLPSKSILTPHPKELERLVGTWKNEDEKIEKVQELSTKYDIIIVIKGAPTAIVYKEELYVNTTGNAALATAGSGDVLTGIITGLMAQGYEPTHAALLGVYLHGLTANIALPEIGPHSFIASDIINNLGRAWLSVAPMA